MAIYVKNPQSYEGQCLKQYNERLLEERDEFSRSLQGGLEKARRLRQERYNFYLNSQN